MTVHLCGRAGHDLTITHQVWCAALELAHMYGWQPLGTHPGRNAGFNRLDQWDGNYLTCDEQVVGEEDARQIAAALRQALDDIPDHDAMQHKTKTIYVSAMPVRVTTTHEYSPIEFLGGSNKAIVQRVIALCDQGSFYIGAQAFRLSGHTQQVE